MIADAQCVCHNRQRRINCRARREEAAVDDIKVVDIVCLAVDIKCRRLWIVSKSNSSVLMRNAGEWNALAEKETSREQSNMTTVTVLWTFGLLLHQVLQLRLQPLVWLEVVWGIRKNYVAVPIERHAIIRVRQVLGCQPEVERVLVPSTRV